MTLIFAACGIHINKNSTHAESDQPVVAMLPNSKLTYDQYNSCIQNLPKYYGIKI